jgi:hypothetical protein
VGATLTGIATEIIGPLAATFVSAFLMMSLILALIALTPVWQIMRREDELTS